MHVLGLGWMGTRTPNFERMVEFVEKVLGLPAAKHDEGLAIFELPNGDLFEVFGPDDPGGGHPESGVVTAFVVDDVETACEELRDAGCEVWDVQTEGVASWAYFRAPDGNLYEVFSGSDLEGG